LVGEYNQAVSNFNALVQQTRSEIEEHNALVVVRNDLALEVQELSQASAIGRAHAGILAAESRDEATAKSVQVGRAARRARAACEALCSLCPVAAVAAVASKETPSC
jgi:hypothetical protein